jgi:hypothetical protein
MTHLLPPDLERLQVRLNPDGDPVAFVWNGHVHGIEKISNRWRINDGWWALQLWRDYFEVRTVSGWWAVLYHDLLNDIWYLERLYN